MKKTYSKKYKFKGIGNKYKNVRSEYDGKYFDSLLELDCYKWLKIVGIDFKTQVKYNLEITSYRADIVIFYNNEEYVIDCKSSSTITQMFKLKSKLFENKIGKEIKCIYSLADLIDYVNKVIYS